MVATRLVLWASLLAATVPAAAARGASFDCARAATAIERAICADSETSALDERLAAAYRAGSATFWGHMVRAEQRAWLREVRDRAAATPGALREAYRQRIAALEEQAAAQGHPTHRALTAAQIAAQCIHLPPDPEAPAGAACRVRESGAPRASGQFARRALMYALYAYPDPAHPANEMLASVATVIVMGGPGGLYAPIFADRRGAVRCGAPRLFDQDGTALLHLPCSQYGTGVFNAESIYAWRGGSWQERDIESWLQELNRRLPGGLEVWKGIYPDYERLTASTPLWRQGDGNCCPTGGRAEMTLGWQGERLVLRELRVTRGAAAAEGR